MANENQTHPKTIYLPAHLLEDLKKHATKRNVAVTSMINNILFDANKKMKQDDQNAGQSATDL